MEERLEKLKNALHLGWGELALELKISRSMLDQTRYGTKQFGPKTMRALIEAEQKAGILPKELSSPARTHPSVRESPADAMPDHRDLSKKLDEILRRLDRLEKKWKG